MVKYMSLNVTEDDTIISSKSVNSALSLSQSFCFRSYYLVQKVDYGYNMFAICKPIKRLLLGNAHTNFLRVRYFFSF